MNVKYYIRLGLIMIFTLGLTFSCAPDKGTVDEKEGVQGDSLNMREGKGEGPIGEGDKGV